MMFLKELDKCTIMSEKCPNCGQLVNASFSRLVKDSCGHTKCRICLMYEAHGCKICQAERNAQDFLGKLVSFLSDFSNPYFYSHFLCYMRIIILLLCITLSATLHEWRTK